MSVPVIPDGGSDQEETAMEKIKVKIRKLEKIETTIGRTEGVG